MKFQYNLTAVELLERIGYSKSATERVILKDGYEREFPIPQVLWDFLSLAKDSRLFSTADIWVNGTPSFYFLYDEIEEMIEEEKEYWEDGSEEENMESGYYKFYKISKDAWTDITPDFLEIGSDFAAGIVKYGICVTDLEQPNPPVYMNHECNDIAEWRLWTEHLSDFLMQVLCDVLLCECYHTGEKVLKEVGWSLEQVYEDQLEDYHIEMEKALKVQSLYRADVSCGCIYEEGEKLLLVLRKGTKGLSGMLYHKRE